MDEWHSFCEVGGCPFTTKLIYLYDRTIRIGQDLGLCSCGFSRRRLKRLIKSLNTGVDCLEGLQRLVDESGELLCRYLKEYVPKHADGFSICNVFSVIIAIETIVESLGVSTTLPLKAYKTDLRSLPSFYACAPSTWQAGVDYDSLLDGEDALHYRILLDRSRMKLRQCIADKGLPETFKLLKEKLKKFSVGDARSYRLNHALPFIALLVALVHRRFPAEPAMPPTEVQVTVDHLDGQTLTISQAAALMLLGHSQNPAFIDNLFEHYTAKLHSFLDQYGDDTTTDDLPRRFLRTKKDVRDDEGGKRLFGNPDGTGEKGGAPPSDRDATALLSAASTCDCQGPTGDCQGTTGGAETADDFEDSAPTLIANAKTQSPRALLPRELLEHLEQISGSKAFEVLELAFFESSPVTRSVIPLLLLGHDSLLRAHFRPSLVLKISLIVVLHNAITEMQSWNVRDYKVEARLQFHKYKQFAFATQQDRVQRQVVHFMHKYHLIHPIVPQWSYIQPPSPQLHDPYLDHYLPHSFDTHSSLQSPQLLYPEPLLYPHFAPNYHPAPHPPPSSASPPTPPRSSPTPQPPRSSPTLESLPARTSAFPQPSPAFPQSSPAFPQPSPAFPQPSPDFPQPSPDFPQPSPDFPQPSPDFSRSSPDFSRSSPDFSRSSPDFHRSSPDFSRSPETLRSFAFSQTPDQLRHPSADTTYPFPKYPFHTPTEPSSLVEGSFYSSSTTCCSFYQPTPPLSYDPHSLAIEAPSLENTNRNNYQLCTILWAPTTASQYVVPGIPYIPAPNTTINFQTPLKCNDIGTTS